MSEREVTIVAAVRTPLGHHKGPTQYVRADEMLAVVLREAVARAGVDPGLVEDVIVGCANPIREQASNVGRVAALMAGLPQHVPGATVQRQCGSAETALHFGCQAILSGDMSVVLVGGVESMSRVPMGSARAETSWHPWLSERYEMISQGMAAERIAARWGLSRTELDAFSLESHRRAVAARERGDFRAETVPVQVTLADGSSRLIEEDDGPRADTSPEKMAALRPAFVEGGVVTAGNSSQMSNGAAAVLLVEKRRAEELGLRPRARVVARAVVGDDPTLMLLGPIPATRRILAKTGYRLDQMDAVEVNEAFASVVLAWAREVGADPEKTNPRGGAIALGHPTGCTGVRMTVTLLHELEQTGGRLGLQTMCHGGGTATATMLERID